jgi:hypothetical protein
MRPSHHPSRGLLTCLVFVLTFCLSNCSSQSVQVKNSTPAANVSETVRTPTTSVTEISREKQIFQEIVKSGGQFTTDANKCNKILQTEDWCNVLSSVINVIRPEWEQLLPKTRFYLVRSMAHSGESEVQNNYIIIEQDGKRYTDKTFDQLLDVNGIDISDENSELIAKALALMTLSDYLTDEITFTKWEEDTTPPPANFDYCLTAWTEIQGYELKWGFVFSDSMYELIAAGPEVVQEKTGDFTEAPEFTLPFPMPQYYYFTRNK